MSRVFAFAGLWATNEKASPGAPIESCTIITCDSAPNLLVSRIHDRMPAILADREELSAWLSPEVTDRVALSLCRAIPAERISLETARPRGERHTRTTPARPPRAGKATQEQGVYRRGGAQLGSGLPQPSCRSGAPCPRRATGRPLESSWPAGVRWPSTVQASRGLHHVSRGARRTTP